MKSFADWTQEIAQSQQGPKPEPELDYRLFDNKIIEDEACVTCAGVPMPVGLKCAVCGRPGRHYKAP